MTWTRHLLQPWTEHRTRLDSDLSTTPPTSEQNWNHTVDLIFAMLLCCATVTLLTCWSIRRILISFRPAATLHSGFDLFSHVKDLRSRSLTVTTRDLNHELKLSHCYYKNIDHLLYWSLKGNTEWTVQSLLSPPGSAVRVSGPGPGPQPPCRPAERWHQVFDAAAGAKRLLALLLRPHLPRVGVQTLGAQGRVHLVLPQQQLLLRWLPPPFVTVVTVCGVIHLLAARWPGRSLLYFLFGLITLTPLHRGGKDSAARHAGRSGDPLGGRGILTGRPLLVLVGGAADDAANGLLVGGGGDAEGRRGWTLCDLWPLQREGRRRLQLGFLCWSLLAGISRARLRRGGVGVGGVAGGDEDIDIGQRLSPVLRSSHLQSWAVLLHLTCNQEVRTQITPSEQIPFLTRYMI